VAVLSAVFKGVDDLSSIFDRMANSGARAVDQWESANSIANSAFSQASTGAEQTAKAMQTAADSTDNWAQAVGSYDKIALEAIDATQELVDLGYKTEDALTAEAEAATEVTNAFNKSLQTTEELKFANSELEAELQQLQNTYTETATQFGENSDEAKVLQKEIGELSKAIDQNKKEFADLGSAAEDAGKTSTDAVQDLSSALAAAGITKIVSDITNSVMEMANEFSNAESAVVKMTGATGTQLDSLSGSMMNVYGSKGKDLSTVAEGISEVNVRLGIQGEELENTTKLFMNYANINRTDVVGSVQTVAKVMKNWDVDISDTEGLLDKLSLASQRSHASVDQLSDMVVTNKATLQQLGYGLDESIALLAMFEDEGLNASSIMMGFRSAVTGFAKDGRDASTAMQEVIEEIGNMANESDATSLAIETFGSRAGAELAYAIKHGKFEIQDWISAVAEADGTLSKTADAASTMQGRWAKASNSMSAAFSKVVSPAVENISMKFADMVGKVGEYLNQHPKIVAALSAAAVGIGVITVAATTFALVTSPMVVTAITAIWTSMGPVGWAVLAVAGLTAAVASFVAILEANKPEYEQWSAATRNQYNELQQLNNEYDRTVEELGKTSAEAQLLKIKVDDMTDSFESSKITFDDYIAKCNQMHEEHVKLITDYENAMSGIKEEGAGTLVLIDRLESLASSTTHTYTEKQQMLTIIDELNKRIPDLSLSYESLTNSVDGTTKSMREQAETLYEQRRINRDIEQYITLLEKQETQATAVNKATKETAAALREYQLNCDYYSNWFDYLDPVIEYDKHKLYKKYKEAYDAEMVARADYDENAEQMRQINLGWDDIDKAMEEAANAQITSAEAVNEAIQSQAAELQALAEKYDQAYESARQSIESTCGLFNTMATEAGASSAEIIEAWQSQIDFLNIYDENLQKLEEFDLDPEFLKRLSDGSQDSANQVNSLIGELDGLDPEEAGKKIKEINDKFAELSTAKDNTATTMAEIKTEFTTEMDEIQKKMKESVDDMDMSHDSAVYAKMTIQAYIDGIKSGVDDARTAAESVASAAASALSGKGISTVGIPGFATGTTNAPDMYIAGEDGPELIVGAGGSTVFPSEATNDILAAAGHVSTNIAAPESMVGADTQGSGAKEEKKILLEINGSGSMAIDKGADKNSMLEILIEHVKPVLLNILGQEVYEEGDLAYEF